jgi:hypothetical protein
MYLWQFFGMKRDFDKFDVCLFTKKVIRLMKIIQQVAGDV